jgi:hypothetical protein
VGRQRHAREIIGDSGLAVVVILSAGVARRGDTMRGPDERSGKLFSYVDLEKRVRADHPLRTIRSLTDAANRFASCSSAFAVINRPSQIHSSPARSTNSQYHAASSRIAHGSSLAAVSGLRAGMLIAAWHAATWSARSCAEHSAT